MNNDKLLRALLQLRNTPDPDCNISPAQIVFGRPLRDSLSFVNRLEKFSNPAIRETWREAWSSKEEALRARFVKSSEKLNVHARQLPTLKVGEKCFLQNQTGNYPKRWDRTGTVMEANGHDQYCVKVDGSGRLTTRNRKFLRAFVPASPVISAPTLPGSKPMFEQLRLTPPSPPLSRQQSPSRSDQSAATTPSSDELDIETPTTQSDDIPVMETTPPQTLVPTAYSPKRRDATLPAVITPQPSRPHRTRRKPLNYEPESGKWRPS